jgi:hypothetical protein
VLPTRAETAAGIVFDDAHSILPVLARRLPIYVPLNPERELFSFHEWLKYLLMHAQQCVSTEGSKGSPQAVQV